MLKASERATKDPSLPQKERKKRGVREEGSMEYGMASLGMTWHGMVGVGDLEKGANERQEEQIEGRAANGRAASWVAPYPTHTTIALANAALRASPRLLYRHCPLSSLSLPYSDPRLSPRTTTAIAVAAAAMASAVCASSAVAAIAPVASTRFAIHFKLPFSCLSGIA